MRSRLGLLLIAASGIACGSRPGPVSATFPAGDHHDDGHGLLARASYSLVTEDDVETAGDAPGQIIGGGPDGELYGAYSGYTTSMYGGGVYGGGGYGGGLYGGNLYGGLGYGGMMMAGGDLIMPAGTTPTYDTEEGLTGSIEGVITWAGAPPPRVTTACGAIDNPSLRVGADKGVGGALVYIEKVTTGRALPVYAKAASVGGVVVKHGCALMPAAQIVTPLPATIVVHGDATAAKLHATPATGAAHAIDLQEGGQAHLDAMPGVTRIDSDDRKVAPAWVVGIDTPYYAITDDGGRFRLDELADGVYDVAVWQAPVASGGAGGTVAYGAPVVAHRQVRVSGSQPARMNVALR